MILSTVSTINEARAIAKKLVDIDRLAACVNIIPNIESVYRWNDTAVNEKECLLVIKASKSKEPEVYKCIRKNHPYDLPEVITIGVQNGDPAYLQWIMETAP